MGHSGKVLFILLSALLLVLGCDGKSDERSSKRSQSLALNSELPEGHNHYCSQEGVFCNEGQGDCDRHKECSSGLVCAKDNGPRFDFSSTTDVCVHPDCVNGILDGDETGIDCGGRCGRCARSPDLISGGSGFCSVAFPCSLWQGDCDLDIECLPGLACGDDNGPDYGLPAGYDVCEPAKLALTVGHADYCSQGVLCEEGYGDCDRNQCRSGLVCAKDNGPRFGHSPSTDVCVDPLCVNGVVDVGEVGVDCGGVCGACDRSDVPTLALQDRCSKVFPCSYGEGDCDSDSHCLAGLRCEENNGPKYGLPRGYDACVFAKKKDRGGIALSFDDHFVSQWFAARSVFQQYDAKVTFFLSRFARRTEHEIQQLYRLQEDGHEIGAHSLDHENAREYAQTYSPQRYIDDQIVPAQALMNNAGFFPRVFAYPYGGWNEQLNEVLFEYFSILRSSRRIRLSELEKILTSPSGPPRFIEGGGIDTKNASLEDILEALRQAAIRKKVIVLYGHRITDEESPLSHVTTEYLHGILAEAQRLGLRFYTMSELVDN